MSVEESVETVPIVHQDKFISLPRNLGYAWTMSLQSCWGSVSSLPSEDQLEVRIKEIQQLWPLYSATMNGQRTDSPSFRIDRSSPFATAQILATHQYSIHVPDDQLSAHIAKDAITKAQAKIDVSDSPLWRVYRYIATDQADQHPSFLVVLIDHVLGDMRGMARLHNALLGETSLLAAFKPESVALVNDTLEARYDHPPSYLVAAQLFARMIWFRLHRTWSRYLPVAAPWPPTKFKQVRVCDAQWDNFVVDINADTVKGLKSAGQTHSVPTLDPLIQTAWLMAMHIVADRQEVGRVRQSRRRFYHIVKSVDHYDHPERRPGTPKDMKMPYCSGINAGVLREAWKVGRQDDFWVMARHSHKNARDPRELELGWRQGHLIQLLPDGPFDPSGRYDHVQLSATPAGDRLPRTLWEKEFFEQTISDEPYADMVLWGAMIANAGFQALPEGCDGLTFASFPHPRQPLMTFVVGHERGISLCSSWLEGVTWNRHEMVAMHDIFLRILRHVAQTSPHSLSVEQAATLGH